MTSLTIVIPFLPQRAEAARAMHALLARRPGLEVVLLPEGNGAPQRLSDALTGTRGEVVVVQEADSRYPLDGWAALIRPIFEQGADAVLARRSNASWPERALARLGQPLLAQSIEDPFTGQRAFRRPVLESLEVQSKGAARTVELMVKTAAEKYRVASVPVSLQAGEGPSAAELAWAVAVVSQYWLGRDDQENRHQGYTSLSRVEAAAPRYNAWLGEKFRAYAGRRVLEVGAGLGTITEQLVPGRERVVALEADPFYVRRLNNRFRGMEHVRVVSSMLEGADIAQLQAEKCDTVVLSNVLEHIKDDGDAVRKFAQLLPAGGRLLILVPALPWLFGAMDEAVGHYRRYTEPALRDVITGNGFALEHLEWMNVLSMPGWFLNGRLFKRTSVPPLQLRLYDRIAPMWAKLEEKVTLPFGQSLFAVARREA